MLQSRTGPKIHVKTFMARDASLITYITLTFGTGGHCPSPEKPKIICWSLPFSNIDAPTVCTEENKYGRQTGIFLLGESCFALRIVTKSLLIYFGFRLNVAHFEQEPLKTKGEVNTPPTGSVIVHTVQNQTALLEMQKGNHFLQHPL